MRLTAAAATDAGPRPANQDAHYVDLELGLLIVADGMGGHNAGEVASQMAVDAVVDFIRATNGSQQLTWPFAFDPTVSLAANRVTAALRVAYRKVHDAGEREPHWSGMGTTIVAVLVDSGRITIGHVGDSRAYCLRGEELLQITEDHTWLNAMLGVEAAGIADHPMRHVLTSGIGMSLDLSPSVSEQPLAVGEHWLICTDGVHGYVDADVIRRMMHALSADAAASAVVKSALDAGTMDNVTAVVLNVHPAPHV